MDTQDNKLAEDEITSKNEILINNDSEAEIFDRIANKLLRSGFLLTALELHAELIERGKESSRLRDYFDNPQNFEKHFDNNLSPNCLSSTTMFPKDVSINRSPSENTFDSLDFTHCSDEDIDRHIGDERIAVLEFELRKARQTIDSLRASLTMTTTGQCSTTVSGVGGDGNTTDGDNNKNNKLIDNKHDKSNDNMINALRLDDYFNNRGSADGDSCPGEDDSCNNNNNINKLTKKSTESMMNQQTMIKPHEKRALNYLINEYLMINNYKITSITFCDENTDQDFDNWDDVGLNISKPPDLLRIYRQFWNNSNRQQ